MANIKTKEELGEEMKSLEANLKDAKEAAKKEAIQKKINDLTTAIAKAPSQEDLDVEVKKEADEVEAKKLADAKAEADAEASKNKVIKSGNGLFFKNSFWCSELKKSIKRGPYAPKDKAEFNILKKYATGIE